MGLERKQSVLLVDDVPDNIHLLGQVLKQRDFDLNFATTGEAALQQIEKKEFDLILLDILMPGMSGYTLCEQLKQMPETRDIPVIFLTAKGDQESTLRGFEAGGVDYITKPFRSAELLARVETHLRLRAAEQQQRAAAEKLRRANARKERFISILSEELCQPLASLAGILRMLDEGAGEISSDTLYEYISMARQTADGVEGLVGSLLEWSAMQQNALPMQVKCIDLAAVAADAAAELQDGIDGKEIQVEASIPVGSFALADPRVVQGVFIQLLKNAIKFSHQGGEVNLTLDAMGEMHCVRVTDRGVGISVEDQERLFSLEKRLKRVGTQGEMGVSMGLILAREMVERSGGEVWLESQEGQGTTACFTLPRCNSDEKPG